MTYRRQFFFILFVTIDLWGVEQHKNCVTIILFKILHFLKKLQNLELRGLVAVDGSFRKPLIWWFLVVIDPMTLFEKVPGPVCSQTPLPPTNIGDHSQKTDAWVHLCFHGERGFMHKISWDHAYMMALGVPLPNLSTMSRNIVYLDDQSKINFKIILKIKMDVFTWPWWTP